MPKKFTVEYSEILFQGMKNKEFSSRANAEKWIAANKMTLYYTSIRVTSPKSKKARPIVLESEDLSGYRKIVGKLEIFHETGMECMGLVIVDETKLGEPNPNFDPSKPEGGHNFRNFGNYDALHFITTGDVLQVEGEDKVLMIKDREFATDDGYRLSFYPQGYSRTEFVTLFYPEKLKATVWTKEKT